MIGEKAWNTIQYQGNGSKALGQAQFITAEITDKTYNKFSTFIDCVAFKKAGGLGDLKLDTKFENRVK